MGKVGQGQFGEVRKVMHRLTGRVMAMKIINKRTKVKTSTGFSFKNEIAILKQLDHPNIVSLYEVYSDNDFIYIVTEYLTGGELFDLVNNRKLFDEKAAAKVMKQILSAVSYCHHKNIAHRDIKPKNILFVEEKIGYDVKIIDFGLSRLFQKDHNMYNTVGSPYYIAPEVLNQKYNQKCDVWSCGVILYILLSGMPPFTGSNKEELNDNIKTGMLRFNGPEWRKISRNA